MYELSKPILVPNTNCPPISCNPLLSSIPSVDVAVPLVTVGKFCKFLLEYSIVTSSAVKASDQNDASSI